MTRETTEFTIREFEPDDWQSYRKIRLEALEVHPEFFCPSRDESQFNEEEWRERIENPNSGVFGLFHHSGEVIGLTGIIRENNESSSRIAMMVGSYIKKTYRGRGLSKLLYQVRLEWARNQGDIQELILEHAKSNLPSKKAHQNFGFQLVEEKIKTFKNGKDQKTLVYSLKI